MRVVAKIGLLIVFSATPVVLHLNPGCHYSRWNAADPSRDWIKGQR